MVREERILTHEELQDLLRKGIVKEIYVEEVLEPGKKYRCVVDFFEGYEEWSNWRIDVWNCRGVLKPVEHCGYGSKPEIEGLEWFSVGYFSIPLKKGEKIDNETAEKIEKILFEELDYHGGAINWSGFYPVRHQTMTRLKLILKGKLFE